MTLRNGLLIFLALAGLIPIQLRATTLLGAGKAVQAFYYNGVFASPEGEDNTQTNTSDPASLLSAVDYVEGAADLSTIHVGDTQIVITNQASPPQPFCFENDIGSACPDQIDGFDFLFTGENIGSVSIDPLSAGDFPPVSGVFQSQTHLGLQLISANEIRVDVTGDDPATGHQLIIDVQGTQSAPEPPTLLLCGSVGIGLLLRRIYSARRASTGAMRVAR
ncbi:MAG TPA: hypothetical protein VKS01_03535 [Bryobacteraceae bacterium]|nr:hypothetical protein [Bryobacteraceae bacterium]